MDGSSNLPWPVYGDIMENFKYNSDGSIDIDLPKDFTDDEIFEAMEKVGAQVLRDYKNGILREVDALIPPKTTFELIVEYFKNVR